MTDEIERLIDCLRGYRINVGKLHHRFSNNVDFRPAICIDAADALEKLAAENDRYIEDIQKIENSHDYWAERCMAAEHDLDYGRSCLTCKYADRSMCDPNAEAGTVALKRWSDCRHTIRDGQNKGLYEWREVQEEENDE